VGRYIAMQSAPKVSPGIPADAIAFGADGDDPEAETVRLDRG
jgi:hypothetical protein